MGWKRLPWYVFLQALVARHLGVEVGQFTWQYDNIQIYDRHIENAIELLNRDPIDCDPYVYINPEKQDFYDMTPDDIKLEGVPRKLIKEKNPQMKFPIGILNKINSCFLFSFNVLL